MRKPHSQWRFVSACMVLGTWKIVSVSCTPAWWQQPLRALLHTVLECTLRPEYKTRAMQTRPPVLLASERVGTKAGRYEMLYWHEVGRDGGIRVGSVSVLDGTVESALPTKCLKTFTKVFFHKFFCRLGMWGAIFGSRAAVCDGLTVRTRSVHGCGSLCYPSSSPWLWWLFEPTVCTGLAFNCYWPTNHSPTFDSLEWTVVWPAISMAATTTRAANQLTTWGSKYQLTILL